MKEILRVGLQYATTNRSKYTMLQLPTRCRDPLQNRQPRMFPEVLNTSEHFSDVVLDLFICKDVRR